MATAGACWCGTAVFGTPAPADPYCMAMPAVTYVAAAPAVEMEAKPNQLCVDRPDGNDATHLEGRLSSLDNTEAKCRDTLAQHAKENESNAH